MRSHQGGVVSADVSQQQLAVRTRVLTLLAWKRLTGVMAASVEVQTLLLNADREKHVTMTTGHQEVKISHHDNQCVCCYLL